MYVCECVSMRMCMYVNICECERVLYVRVLVPRRKEESIRSFGARVT